MAEHLFLALLKSVETVSTSALGSKPIQPSRFMVEAERYVYANRAKYLGDPDFIKVPVESLLTQLKCA